MTQYASYHMRSATLWIVLQRKFEYSVGVRSQRNGSLRRGRLILKWKGKGISGGS